MFRKPDSKILASKETDLREPRLKKLLQMKTVLVRTRAMVQRTEIDVLPRGIESKSTFRRNVHQFLFIIILI